MKSEPLLPVTMETPIGTPIVRVDDQGQVHLSRTRSAPWELDEGRWLVLVDGISGGYLASRCHVLPEPELPLSDKELDQLTALDSAGTCAPWAYTENCGAQVCVGLIHDQEPGMVRMEKGGFFLFEIEPDAYDRGDDSQYEEDLARQAYADAKLIALARNYLPRLIETAKKARGR